MNILVQLAHPAQFYFFHKSIKSWEAKGHKVVVAIKTKDILEKLVKNANVRYYNINRKQHRGTKLGMLWDMIYRDIRLIVLCKKERIDILTGSTSEVAQVAWFLRLKSVCIGEDDADIVPIYVKTVLPFLQTRLTPTSCRCGKMESKSIHYAGFQKLAYLHPNVFSPLPEIVNKYGIDIKEPYFIIRLVSLTAHHDSGIKGLNKQIVKIIINMLEPVGNVYISSEKPLDEQFEKYRLKINPLDIHHVMAFSSLLLGDSQSMAVEAAMLGIPNIRFNDFAGKKNIGVLEELEFKYGLTKSIPSSKPDDLVKEIKSIIENRNIKNDYQRRQKKMLSEKIDVSAFLTWFIEDYPESKKIMQKNPDYQYRFM